MGQNVVLDGTWRVKRRCVRSGSCLSEAVGVVVMNRSFQATRHPQRPGQVEQDSKTATTPRPSTIACRIAVLQRARSDCRFFLPRW